MMGHHQGQTELISYAVDLDKRVRADHPLRRIAAEVDFSFVREEVKHLYGKNGNESVDPEILMKLMFLLFYENVSSERALMRILPERLDWLWFMRMNLDDSIPDHSVLSKARARWGEEVFESFFVQIVKQCVEAGLVEGSKIHMDGSLINANASKDSVLKGPQELMDALREAYKAEEKKLGGSLGAPNYVPQNRRLMSTTDPDAPCVRHSKMGGSGDSRPRYKNHRSVDDAHGVITATRTTTGDVEENKVAEDLVDQHEKNTEKKVETVIGDRQYGTVDNYRRLQGRGINTHMSEMHGNNKRFYEGIFEPDKFTYNSEQDVYRCPADQLLYPRRYNKKRKSMEYLTRKGVCDKCELRDQCTKAKHGRSIMRHHQHELIEKAREQCRTREARKDLGRRRHLMEGSFADATQHHFKRSRWRRLGRQTIQDLIIATVQNIKILVRHGRKPEGTAIGLLSMALLAHKCFKRALYAALTGQAAIPVKT